MTEETTNKSTIMTLDGARWTVSGAMGLELVKLPAAVPGAPPVLTVAELAAVQAIQLRTCKRAELELARGRAAWNMLAAAAAWITHLDGAPLSPAELDALEREQIGEHFARVFDRAARALRARQIAPVSRQLPSLPDTHARPSATPACDTGYKLAELERERDALAARVAELETAAAARTNTGAELDAAELVDLAALENARGAELDALALRLGLERGKCETDPNLRWRVRSAETRRRAETALPHAVRRAEEAEQRAASAAVEIAALRSENEALALRVSEAERVAWQPAQIYEVISEVQAGPVPDRVVYKEVPMANDPVPVDDLRAQIRRLEQDYQAVCAERDSAKVEAERVRSELSRVRLSASGLEDEAAMARAAYEAVRAELRRVEAEHVERTAGAPLATEEDAELAALRADLAAVREKYRRTRAELEEATAERDTLENTAKILRRDLTTSEGMLHAARKDADHYRDHAASRDGMAVELALARQRAEELRAELARVRAAALAADDPVKPEDARSWADLLAPHVKRLGVDDPDEMAAELGAMYARASSAALQQFASAAVARASALGGWTRIPHEKTLANLASEAETLRLELRNGAVTAGAFDRQATLITFYALAHAWHTHQAQQSGADQ